MTEKNSRKELHYGQAEGAIWKVTQQSGKAHPEDPNELQSLEGPAYQLSRSILI